MNCPPPAGRQTGSCSERSQCILGSNPSDWLRILASRFRGRGPPADRYDVWLASLGPSESLLKSVLAGKIAWREFSKRFRDEMFAPAAADTANATIKNHGQKFINVRTIVRHGLCRGSAVLQPASCDPELGLKRRATSSHGHQSDMRASIGRIHASR
jgi:uncharacterized protein YeaO (DUF488 family)